MTQATSKPRVKADGIGEDTMKTLYDAFGTASTEDYKLMCLEVIGCSNAKPATKLKFNDLITQSNSKAAMLTRVTNFFLAGEGKGV